MIRQYLGPFAIALIVALGIYPFFWIAAFAAKPLMNLLFKVPEGAVNFFHVVQALVGARVFFIAWERIAIGFMECVCRILLGSYVWGASVVAPGVVYSLVSSAKPGGTPLVIALVLSAVALLFLFDPLVNAMFRVSFDAPMGHAPKKVIVKGTRESSFEEAKRKARELGRR